MRKPKYRAWNKEKKIMIYSDKEGLNCFFDIISDDLAGIYDNFIVMYYTGLKDKNNKKIYDEDIMQDFVRKEHLNEIDRGIVKYDLSQTAFIIDVNWANKKLGRIYNRFEVVGNIYENPELLEKK